MNYKGVDTAWRISPAAAKILYDEGYRFVGRYLVPERLDKHLTAGEAADIRNAGLAILLIWEIEADRAKRGAEIGAADGKTARELAKAMGVPDGTAICFAVDFEAYAKDYAAIRAYFVAAKAAVYPYSVGIYAPPNVLNNLSDVVPYRWETYAWCYGTTSPVKQVKQSAYQELPEAKALAAKIGVDVDLDVAVSLAGMWTPSQSASQTALPEGEPRGEAESSAVAWARGLGLLADPDAAVTEKTLAEWLYEYDRRRGGLWEDDGC